MPNKKEEDPLLVETDENLIDRYRSKYPEMEERKVLERFGERDEAGNITGKLTESGKEIMLSHLGDRKQTIQPKPATEMIGEVRKKIAEGTFDTKSKSEWVGGDYVRSQIAAFIGKRQGLYKSTSTGENVLIGSNNISPKQEADIASFVATIGKKNTTSQKNLRILSDFLDNQNITDYSQITPKKVIKYLVFSLTSDNMQSWRTSSLGTADLWENEIFSLQHVFIPCEIAVKSLAVQESQVSTFGVLQFFKKN